MTAKDIQFIKVAVNPASRKAYVAVRSLKTKQDVILTIRTESGQETFHTFTVKIGK